MEALKASAYKVFDQTGVPARHIAGISYDATTMTVVCLDQKGNALRNAIMWMDVRATEQAARADTIDHWAKPFTTAGESCRLLLSGTRLKRLVLRKTNQKFTILLTVL